MEEFYCGNTGRKLRTEIGDGTVIHFEGAPRKLGQVVGGGVGGLVDLRDLSIQLNRKDFEWPVRVEWGDRCEERVQRILIQGRWRTVSESREASGGFVVE